MIVFNLSKEVCDANELARLAIEWCIPKVTPHYVQRQSLTSKLVAALRRLIRKRNCYLCDLNHTISSSRMGVCNR
jgi:hypothetical protein